ncbi:hypothetical protein B0H21DRAFT_823516 [Amylocystis lapponica]|nr:hypothetical protein B0H21DRAFT_823516 [Amylocystis lapponica]
MPMSTSAVHTNSLKQNQATFLCLQACHQCRKRQLKWSVPEATPIDAKKPCSTCAHSHAYTVAHAPPGAHLPPHPDCTFDAIVTVPEVNIPISEHYDSPKDRFERLKSRINQLETLLQEKERNPHSPNMPPDGSASTSTSDSSMVGVSPDPGMLGGGSSTLDGVLTFDPFDGVSTLQSDTDLGFSQFQPDSFGTPGIAGLMDITLSGLADTLGHTTPPNTVFGAQHLHAASNMEILPYGWPRNLPEPKLVRHLVEALFAFDVNTPRLFHGPSFLASLSRPPRHVCGGEPVHGAGGPAPDGAGKRH